MKKIIEDIFSILHKKEKQQFWTLLLADVLISMLDLLFLFALLYIIGFYTRAGYPSTAVQQLQIWPRQLFAAHPIGLILVFFLLFTAKNMIGFRVASRQYHFVYRVASRISRQLMSEYLAGSYQDYVNVDSSVANRKINQQPIEFGHYLLNGLQQLLGQSLLVLLTIAAIVFFNPLLFPLLLGILAPPVFLVFFFMKRKLAAATLHGKKTGEKTLQHLQEAIAGFVESNLYQKNDFFTHRYHRLQEKLNHYLSERLVIQQLPGRLIEVFAIFGLLVLVWLNVAGNQGHSIPLVTVGALMIAAYKIIPGITKITNTIGQLKTYSFATAGIATVTGLRSEKKLSPVTCVAFDQVDFDYAGKNILSSFSLTLQTGDFAVLSGTSGKGKTTLINLLLGFLQPAGGKVCINGQAAEAPYHQDRMAYVKQQTFLLHASILENITLQEGDADIVKLDRIVAMTGLNKIMAAFPDGLATIITENGKNFSGGQRQRIVLARALYKEADLLLLDEPFNELDEASEGELLAQLQLLAHAGKIIILITHNKAAMAFGNKKIDLDA